MLSAGLAPRIGNGQTANRNAPGVLSLKPFWKRKNNASKLSLNLADVNCGVLRGCVYRLFNDVTFQLQFESSLDRFLERPDDKVLHH